MRRLPTWFSCGLLCVVSVTWLNPRVATAASIAILPLQDRTGSQEAVEAVQRELTTQLLQFGSIVSSEEVRDTLRRLRVRQAEKATPETLSQVGEGVGADWLVSVTIHEANVDTVPRLTLSARAYGQESGEALWIGFQSGSGLTPRTILGLKEIRNLSLLTQRVIERLVEDLAESTELGGPGSRTNASPAVERLGRVAVVPFGGFTARRSTAHSETVTEAVRAVAYRNDFDLLSPNRVNGTLKRQQELQWGGVSVPLREDLTLIDGADTILTGSVEAFDIDASPDGPRPRIAVSMRLIEARTGRVLWADGEEKDIADRPGYFGTRRIYSLGALTLRMVESLTQRLLKENRRATATSG